ncbi:uncharacterized protein LOC131147699 isoform X2 [Malania oleifera]|uniref:uncharacterized protein LOC131147699 isoform X2 n=1 Tax=Malania oleifera TaxID=397392 RepID=UPI0025ADC2CF|nr:uncharacterized protein LOC131147699 isoform X2 [Malania oleifera]
MRLCPPTMCKLHLVLIIWVFSSALSGSACCPYHFVRQANRRFEQKTDRFWKFEQQSNSWVEVKLPFDLVSCVDGNCTKVGSISRGGQSEEGGNVHGQKESLEESSDDAVLPLRKRISLIRISDTAIWVTGPSGSIYQRFWNGVQWVISPHDLPAAAGYAVSVFLVNQTILVLSETGDLYQLRLSESAEPIWVHFTPTANGSSSQETEQNPAIRIKSGVVSDDGVRVYFCTRSGSLLELTEIEPPGWVNHGRPAGANVAAIADVDTIRPEVVFTVSSTGDLYEYDRSSKPSWKKHIWSKGSIEAAALLPSRGCSLLDGAHSMSLFLLTKGGNLVERRLHQRKWKWIIHGSPKDHHLTSITPVSQDINENSYSLFFSTATGSIFEYQIPKSSGSAQENQIQERWVNHMHPLNAKAVRGVEGLQLQVGRILFPLDDGRLAELHLSGLGDAPETEGWNAEYCTEERGPANCISGIKDEANEVSARSIPGRRKRGQAQQSYLPPGVSGSSPSKQLETYKFPENWIKSNFRLRLLYGGRSFFFVTSSGLTFECLYAENAWLWLRHEHSTAMEGALGNYNGSLFLVDKHGSLLIRGRRSNELAWINCTAMRKGRQVISGPPWDAIPGEIQKLRRGDSLFFVSKSGRLLQFTVAMRNFTWKDCRNPPNTKIACIVDQEVFRENIVFVVGRNGRLYQYNKITELWHEHHQSQHLVLSRLPGTAVRPSSLLLSGSVFMLSEDGGLVEYHWNPLDGWNWVEHGTPDKSVTLVTAPGPCFEGNHLFLIGSDGKVYLRYMDQTTWKWKNHGFPCVENLVVEDERRMKYGNEEICIDGDFAARLEKVEENIKDLDGKCDQKVASVRPIPFSNNSVLFELRDGRLAEMQRMEDSQWTWRQIIGTPISSCTQNYWMALAS